MPYRDAAALAVAEQAGVFGGSGGQFAASTTGIAADLATLEATTGYGEVPSDPTGTVGADLAGLLSDLSAAEDAVLLALQSVATTPDPSLPPDPSATPEPGPDAAALTAELSRAAARYGSEVTRVADAYTRAAELATLADRCDADSAIDMSAAVDAIITTSVGQQIAAEGAHLATVTERTAQMQAAMAELNGSYQQVQLLAQELSVNISGQLASVASLRESTAGLLTQQRTLSASLSETGSMTLSAAMEGTSLLAASESLLMSTQYSVEQAGRLSSQTGDVRGDVDGLITGSTELATQSDDLAEALTTQVEDAQVFADSFSGVLANAHSSGVLNERLMKFLAAPVEGNQRESISTTDVARPFPWVLISFALCFIAAYVLATVAEHRRRRSAFTRERTAWFGINLRALGLAVATALVIGAGIAWVSVRDLGIARESQVSWVLCVLLVCVELTLVAHWLVKQWRTVGVGVSVLLLVGYVFVSSAVGYGARSGASALVAALDPLSHAESAMVAVLGESLSAFTVSGQMIVWIIVAVVLNLLIQEDPRRFLPRRDRDQDRATAVPA